MAMFINTSINPKVNILKGSKKKFKMGLIKQFATPMIAPARMKIFIFPVKSTSGINFALRYNPKMLEIVWKKKF